MEYIVHELLAKKLEEARPDVTKRTIQLRVLREIAEKHLYIDMNTIYDLKTQTYLPDDILHTIQSVWEKHLLEPATHQEKNTFQKFLSRDYHKDGDLTKIATLLHKKVNSEGRRILDDLFAVDGFDGDDYKYYISNLGNHHRDSIYCNAVRKLYEVADMDQQGVHDVIVKALNKEIGHPLATLFREAIGENRFDAIAEAKRKEIEKKKASKNKKRKSEDNNSDNNSSQ